MFPPSSRARVQLPQFWSLRLRDVAVAVGALAMLWPVIVLGALAVKLESPGPAIFRQTRVGQYGRHFRILKLRTMKTDSSGPAITASHDGRVTRVGRILRATKIDELPQLWNVLMGEMSVVGPRPEVPEFVALWPAGREAVILSVRPGITDPASVLLRNEAQILRAHNDEGRAYVELLLPLKTRMYVEYVNTRSFKRDLAIVWATVWAVIFPSRPRPDGLSAHSKERL